MFPSSQSRSRGKPARCFRFSSTVLRGKTTGPQKARSSEQGRAAVNVRWAKIRAAEAEARRAERAALDPKLSAIATLPTTDFGSRADNKAGHRDVGSSKACGNRNRILVVEPKCLNGLLHFRFLDDKLDLDVVSQRGGFGLRQE